MAAGDSIIAERRARQARMPISNNPNPNDANTPFAPDSKVIGQIKGFQDVEVSDSVVSNLYHDIRRNVEGGVQLVKMVAEDPSIAGEIASKLPEALKQSYTRWFDAAEKGVLTDAILAHPGEFAADWALPVTLIGATGKIAAQVAKLPKLAATAGTITKIGLVGETVSDPITGLALYGTGKAIGKTVKGIANKVAGDKGPRLNDDLIQEATTKPTSPQNINPTNNVESANPHLNDIIDKTSDPQVPLRENKITDFDKKANELLNINVDDLDEVGKFAGNLNLEKTGHIPVNFNTGPNSQKDWNKTIDFIVKNEKDKLTKKGVVSVDETTKTALNKMAAQEAGFTVEDFLNKRKGGFASAAEAKAGIMMGQHFRNELVKSLEIANGVNAGPIDKANFVQAYTRYIAAQENLATGTSETARSLQIFNSIPKNEALQKTAIDSIIQKAGGDKYIDTVIKDLSGIDDATLFAKQANGYSKATTWEQVQEVWINGLLSGPQTQAVNIGSNAVTSLYAQALEPNIAATIGLITRNPDRITFRENVGRLNGLMKGMSVASKKGFLTFLPLDNPDLIGKMPFVGRTLAKRAEKITAPELPGIDASKLETGKIGGRAVPGFVGSIIRTPGRALEGGDAFFKMINYSSELEGLATRKGLKQGLKGKELSAEVARLTANPSEELSDAAWEVARKNTFTSDLGGNAITDVAKKIQELATVHPWIRVGFPFIRTPANIAKFSLERTPVGFAFKEMRDDIFKHKGIRRDQALAKIALGTAFMVGAGEGVRRGLITGGQPKDRKERATLEAQDWQEYSVLVGDRYMSYARFEPIASIIGLGADMEGMSDLMTDGELKEVATLLIGSISKNMSSKTFLRGMTEGINAWQDPDRYGDRYWNNLFSTVVPTGIASIARADDPFLRRADTIMEKVRSRLPGESETLAPLVNIKGEPRSRERFETGNEFLSKSLATLNPIYLKTKTFDPILNEMTKAEAFVGYPSKKIGGVELTPKQYNDYIKISWDTGEQTLKDFISSPEWKMLPKHTKQEAIDKVVRYSREVARGKMQLKYPDLRQKIYEEGVKQ